jgi:hypothetical protein
MAYLLTVSAERRSASLWALAERAHRKLNRGS